MNAVRFVARGAAVAGIAPFVVLGALGAFALAGVQLGAYFTRVFAEWIE